MTSLLRSFDIIKTAKKCGNFPRLMSADSRAIALACSGGAGSGSALFSYWEDHDCQLAYQQVLNTDVNGNLQYTQHQLEIVQGLVVKLFDTYQSTNVFTDNVTNSQYSSFQNQIVSLCTDSSLPGVCESALTSYCSNKSRDLTTQSRILTDLCGCYVPPDPHYLKYTLGTPDCLTGGANCHGCSPASPTCVGQPACDPLCHRATTSHKANPVTGDIIGCSENVCVIDDTVISATNSHTGGISYNQVCGGCQQVDGCLCIISGVNPADAIGRVGLGVNYNQFCGPSSVCITEDASGNVVSEGGCQTLNTNDVTLPSLYHPTWVIVVVMVVILILIIVFLIAMRYP